MFLPQKTALFYRHIDLETFFVTFPDFSDFYYIGVLRNFDHLPVTRPCICLYAHMYIEISPENSEKSTSDTNYKVSPFRRSIDLCD
jgi:hypothetical protein